MKAFTSVFSIMFACVALSAQAPAWQPSPGHTQVPIWPGAPPHAQQTAGAEIVTTTLNDHLVAGRSLTYISNVSRPTRTVYSPKGNNTGAAVVVFPGGGYQILAIDLEGTEVCEWLTSSGITCVLLKYRVPNSGPTWDQRCGCDIKTRSSMPLEDAQRTVGLVRFHAAEWHIDPHKIGVLGFSAGGHLVAAVSTHFERRVYPAVDAADQESSRPDFAVALYPGHLLTHHDKSALNPDIHVTRSTPPTFLLHAENDSVDGVSNSLTYYIALKNAGTPANCTCTRKGAMPSDCGERSFRLRHGLARSKHGSRQSGSFRTRWFLRRFARSPGSPPGRRSHVYGVTPRAATFCPCCLINGDQVWRADVISANGQSSALRVAAGSGT